MARKKKAKSSVEYLWYPGRGFDPEKALAMPSGQGHASDVRFVSPTAHVGAAASEDLPPGSSTGIDAPLSPRTRVVKEELCLEASPSALPGEGERQIQGQETEIAREDPHAYVPQESRSRWQRWTTWTLVLVSPI